MVLYVVKGSMSHSGAVVQFWGLFLRKSQTSPLIFHNFVTTNSHSDLSVDDDDDDNETCHGDKNTPRLG